MAHAVAEITVLITPMLRACFVLMHLHPSRLGLITLKLHDSL